LAPCTSSSLGVSWSFVDRSFVRSFVDIHDR
jgi:hypothetical protein